MESDLLTVGDDTYTVQTLKQADVPSLQSLFEKEGWPFTLNDLTFYYKLYKDAFVGVYSSTDHLVGHICIFKLNEDTVYVGKLIITSDVRGSGIGSLLIQRVLQKFHDFNTTLIAVPGSEKFYNSIGLKETPHSIYTLDKIVPRLSNTSSLVSVYMEEGTTAHEEEIASYINDATGYERSSLISAKLRQPETKCYIARQSPIKTPLQRQVSAHRLLGVIMVTNTNDVYYRVSAWYCNNSHIAKALLEHSVVKLRPKKAYRIVFPGDNLENVLFATQGILTTSRAMLPAPEKSYSTTGEIPGVCWEKVFGSFEATNFFIV